MGHSKTGSWGFASRGWHSTRGRDRPVTALASGWRLSWQWDFLYSADWQGDRFRWAWPQLVGCTKMSFDCAGTKTPARKCRE